MSSLLQRRRWPADVPPPPHTRIDPQSPLARGLVFALAMNDDGGYPIDLVRGHRGTSITGFVAKYGSRGFYVQGVDGSAQWQGVPDAPFLKASGLTLLWRGIRTATTGNFAAAYKGPSSGSGATNTPFDFGSQDSSNVTLVRATAGASGYRSWRPNLAGSLPALNVERQIIVATPTNLVETPPTWFLSGGKAVASVAGAFTTATTGPATGAAGPLQHGIRGDEGTAFTGFSKLLLAWDRPLSQAEADALWENPYGWLMPPGGRSRLFAVDFGTAGGTSASITPPAAIAVTAIVLPGIAAASTPVPPAAVATTTAPAPGITAAATIAVPPAVALTASVPPGVTAGSSTPATTAVPAAVVLTAAPGPGISAAVTLTVPAGVALARAQSPSLATAANITVPAAALLAGSAPPALGVAVNVAAPAAVLVTLAVAPAVTTSSMVPGRGRATASSRSTGRATAGPDRTGRATTSSIPAGRAVIR